MSQQRRGRETALDMVRTLGVVFALVGPLCFAGQSAPGDSKDIRPVDPSAALKAFAADTGGPVLGSPEGWTVNVSSYDGTAVRVGLVRDDSYAEFSGSKAPGFLEQYAGKGSVEGTVEVGGVTWDRYVSTDDHESLVRSDGGVTVLVGGLRETASLEELRQLAATVG